jgi:hypothetical protein
MNVNQPSGGRLGEDTALRDGTKRLTFTTKARLRSAAGVTKSSHEIAQKHETPSRSPRARPIAERLQSCGQP